MEFLSYFVWATPNQATREGRVLKTYLAIDPFKFELSWSTRAVKNEIYTDFHFEKALRFVIQ